ncbi:UNVERIFIED_CONTAM: hypothetical protein K2H54_046554 [Gekko kuhli]
MAQDAKKKKRPPPPSGAPEGEEMATAMDPVEQLPITSEASGVRPQEDQRLEVASLQRTGEGSSTDPRGFKKPIKIQIFSPFLDYFDDVIQEEWANPGGGTSLLSIAKHLYSLPEETTEDLKVPLRKDGENALKDAMDRKNETVLKKAHEAMSLAICSTAALSNFTRATAIWADNFLQNPEASSLVLR